jgi:hypothetical protein
MSLNQMSLPKNTKWDTPIDNKELLQFKNEYVPSNFDISN